MLLTSVSWACHVSIILLILMYTSVLCSSSSSCDGHDSLYRITTINGDVKCAPCTKCPVGFGVVTECRDERDTQCEPCADGTYSGGNSRISPCRSCTTCPPHLPTTRNCTSTQNAKCAGECDDAYFQNDLTGECSPCSWCFPNKPEIAPPVIQECVDQRMPRNYRCMPSSNGGDVPTYMEYKAHIEVNYQLSAQNLGTEFVKLENITVSTTPAIPSHHHVTIPIVVTSGIVVFVCLIVLIAILVQRLNKGKSHTYENIDERFGETDEVEGRDRNGYCNLVEQHEYNKYSPAEEDAVAYSVAVQYGKETDNRRCVELNHPTEKTRIV